MTDGLKHLTSHMDIEGEQVNRKSKAYINSSPTNGKQNSKADRGTYSYHRGTDQGKPNAKINPPDKGKSVCVYCGDRHCTRDCENYSTVAARQSRLVELYRCGRCALAQNNADNCNMVLVNCKRCHKGKHHTALCFPLWHRLQLYCGKYMTAYRGKPSENHSP